VSKELRFGVLPRGLALPEALACGRRGRDRAPGGGRGHGVATAKGRLEFLRSRALARDHARGRVASAVRHPLPVRLSDEDEAAIRTIREAYDAYEHATAGSRHRTLVPDRLVDLMALAGTPDGVAAQARRLQTLPELRRVIILPQAPDAGFIAREEILTMYADEVMARAG